MKTLIDVDEDLMARAAVELGTASKKDTVNQALAYVAERAERARQALAPIPDQSNPVLHLGIGEDAGDSEVMDAARR